MHLGYAEVAESEGSELCQLASVGAQSALLLMLTPSSRVGSNEIYGLDTEPPTSALRASRLRPPLTRLTARSMLTRRIVVGPEPRVQRRYV